MRQKLIAVMMVLLTSCGGDSITGSMKVTTVEPVKGSAQTLVTISGKNFGSRGLLHLGETPIVVKSWQPTEIQFELIAETPPGDWPILLSANGKKTKSDTTFRVEPHVDQVQPEKGIGGAPVVITGTNFGSAAGTVFLEGAGVALAVKSWNATAITAELPMNAVGGKHSIVISQNDVAGNSAPFSVSPVATSVTPVLGSGGDSFAITGQGFGNDADEVWIGDTRASIKSWGQTLIQGVVPVETKTGIQSVKVVVGGEKNTELIPLVMSISPRITAWGISAALNGSTHLVLSGTNFGATQGSSTVTLDADVLTVSGWSNTSLDLIFPSGTLAGDHVAYITSNGAVSDVLLFQILPAISSLTPTRISGGMVLNVNGAFFGEYAGTLQIGSTVLPTGLWTNTLIQTSALSSTVNPGTYTVYVSDGLYDGEKNGLVVAPVISSLSSAKRRGGEALTLTGKNFGSSVGTVTVDGLIASTSLWNSTSIVLTVPNSARPGSRSVIVAGGGIDSDPRTLVVTPYITLLSATTAARFESLTLTGTGLTSGAPLDSVLVGVVPATISSWGVLSTTIVVPDLEANTYAVSVQSGGETSNSLNLSIAPSVSDIAPTTGDAGTTVVLRGAAFGALQLTASVTMGGLNATVLSWSPTAITVTVPAVLSGGTVPVVVIRNGISSGAVGFTFRPVIGNAFPSSQSIGRTMTLAGSHFGTSGTVTVDSIPASISGWTDGLITLTIPALGLGVRNVVVSRNGISSAPAPMTILPGIDAFDRQRAPEGATVTFTGTNLGATQGASTFHIGPVTIAPTLWSSTAVQFTVPALPMGTYAAQVTVSSLTSYAVPFTVAAGITSMSPVSGSTPSVVTLAGDVFGDTQGGSTVSIGGMAASIQSWSNAQIMFVVPAALTAGPTPVFVQVNGVNTQSHSFLVVSKIVSLSKTTGRSGDAVSIFGNHFGTAGTLRLTDIPVASTLWNNGQINFAVPSPIAGSHYQLWAQTNGYASNARDFLVTPVIDSVSPGKGIAATAVSLTGVHFGAAQGTVLFGGAPATIVSWSNTLVQFRPPVTAAVGTANTVLVVNQVTTNALPYMLAPDLTAVSSTAGPGFKVITLTGSQFGASQGASQVNFGANPVTTMTWSDTSITVAYGSDFEPGLHAVTVTVNGVASASRPFSVTPVLSTMTPLSAGGPGSSVHLTGIYLGASTSAKKVLFDENEQTPTSWTPTDVDFVVPAYATPGSHSVALLAGGLRTGSKWFDVVRPWIGGRSPAHGVSGTVVTLVGKGFGATPGAVTIGGFASTIQSWTSDTVQVSVPADLTPGEVMIVMTAQSESNHLVFTIDGTNQWQLPDEPSSRSGSVAVWTGTEMLVVGGYISITGGKYNPVSDSWTAMRRGGVPAMTPGSAVWTGKEMLVYGKVIGTAAAVGSRYDPANDSWTTISATNQPAAWTEQSAVWTGTQMILWGGRSTAAPLSTGGRYYPATNTWATVSQTNVPVGRSRHAAAFTGNEMLVWGGSNNNGGQSNGGRYNPQTDVWSPMNATNGPAGSFHAGAWSGTRFVVYGGSGATGRYDPGTDTWQASAAGAQAMFFNSVWTGSELVIWGGLFWGGPDLGPGRYNPVTNVWTANPVDIVLPRVAASIVWTGTEMLIFGGSVGNYDDVRHGARFRPSDNTIVPMGGVTPQLMNSVTGKSVWTGSQLILWGGLLGGARTNTGQRYDPATETWLPTSTTGAPSARTDFSAVWTGTQMAVWGGITPTYVQTGGLYNPATNSWQTITTSGAPSGRSVATAVWDGTRVMIWGGLTSASTSSGTGASYRPALNSWVSMTATGAPAARDRHTAVWVGNRMVIWGGPDSSPFDGRNYDPVLNTWSFINSTGAPEVRYYEAYAATDTEMLVWGGHSSTYNGELADGARYNPTTNAWSTMAASPLSARNKPGFLWTGSELLIWGGGNSQSAFADGAKYNPGTDTWSSIASAPEAGLGASGFFTPNGVFFFVNNTLMRYLP